MVRDNAYDVAEYIRQNVSAGSGKDPVYQYGSVGEDGQLSIGLTTSLLGEELDLIEEREDISILEIVTSKIEDPEEELELILYVDHQE